MIVVHSFPIGFYDIPTKWAPQNDSEVGEQFSNVTMVYGTQIAIVISWGLSTNVELLGHIGKICIPSYEYHIVLPYINYIAAI